MDREHTRAIIAQVTSYSIFTQFYVKNGVLWVRVPGGPSDEQKKLISQYKDEIKEFLTTPPARGGDCIRKNAEGESHPIRWECSQYGLWVCACFLLPYTPVPQPKLLKPASNNVRNYWTKDNSLTAEKSRQGVR